METIDELIEESGYFLPDDEFVDKVASAVRSSSYKLIGIWKELGITGECLRDRQQKLLQYQSGIISGMITEESKTLQRIREKVRLLEEEMVILRIQLKIEENELISFDLTNPTLLQREAWLKSTVENLLDLKDTKMEEYNTLSREEQELCAAMSLRQKYCAALFGPHEIPCDEIIESLRQHIGDLKEEKRTRENCLVQFQNQIHKLIKELEEAPLEMNIFQKDFLYEPDQILLSEENLIQARDWLEKLQEKLKNNEIQIASLKKRLNSLWDLLEVDNADRELILSQYPRTSLKTITALVSLVGDLEEQRRANMGKCFDKAMSRLSEWWDKCMVSDEEREAFEDLINGDYTEENLALVEAELKKQQEFYETNELLLSKILKRLNLWDKMIDFEKKCQDKTRYHNRGGNLLKEEKDRKTLLKSIPKLEKEIHLLVTEWEVENELTFKIFGIPVDQYFINQWDEYQAEKDNIKTQRHQRNTPGTSYMISSTPSNNKRNITTPNTKTLTPKKLKLTPYTPSGTNVFSRIPAVSTSRHHLTPGSPRLGRVEPTRRVSTRIQNRQKENKSQIGKFSHLPLQGTPLNRKRKSATLLESRIDANLLTVPSSPSPNYSVTYDTFKKKIQRQMTSTEVNSPTETLAMAPQHSAKIVKPHIQKVIGSKVVKRYSNEAQRRRSFNSTSRNGNRKLPCNVKPSRYELRRQGDSFQV